MTLKGILNTNDNVIVVNKDNKLLLGKIGFDIKYNLNISQIQELEVLEVYEIEDPAVMRITVNKNAERVGSNIDIIK